MTSNPLVEKIQNLREQQSHNDLLPAEDEVRRSLTKPGQQLQIPFWPNVIRALPNAFARCALFTVGNRNKARKQLKQHQVASISSMDVFYTGEELRQDDEDLVLQLLHLHRNQSVDEWVRFTRYAMIRELGWTVNKASYIRLKQSLIRLKSNALEISVKNGQRGYVGSIIRDFAYSNDAGEDLSEWAVRFEPAIANMFGNDAYSQLYWQTRMALTPAGKWLHSWFSSHREPYPISIEKIGELCGWKGSKISDLRDAIKNQLELMQEKGFLESWDITDNNLVAVKRNRKSLELA